jgi:hypothetical protein
LEVGEEGGDVLSFDTGTAVGAEPSQAFGVKFLGALLAAGLGVLDDFTGCPAT